MISEDYIKLVEWTMKDEQERALDFDKILPNMHYWWNLLSEYWRDDMSSDHTYSALSSLAGLGLRALSAMNGKSIERNAEYLIDTHKRKNAGYSGNDPDPWKNFREIEKFGISSATGCLTRLSDKWARFNTIYGHPELDQVNESVIDTMLDFTAYCFILCCLLEELP